MSQNKGSAVLQLSAYIQYGNCCSCGIVLHDSGQSSGRGCAQKGCSLYFWFWVYSCIVVGRKCRDFVACPVSMRYIVDVLRDDYKRAGFTMQHFSGYHIICNQFFWTVQYQAYGIKTVWISYGISNY